jgi:hypothetical protein
MFDRMRRDLDDRHIPDWQRQTLQRLTGWGEILAAALTGQIVAGLGMPSARTMEELLREAGEYCVEKIILPWWPILLLLLLLLWLIARLWPRRYGLGVAGLLFGAHVLVRWRPMLSMRLSARALNWCLRQQGHEPVGGQSVREHLAGASSVPDLPRRWLGYAVDLYCETRFGSMAATRQRAANMHKVIHAASQILAGVMPELMRG